MSYSRRLKYSNPLPIFKTPPCNQESEDQTWQPCELSSRLIAIMVMWPELYNYYYFGIRAKYGWRSYPKLVARSSRAPWTYPKIQDYGWGSQDFKTMCSVMHHPLRNKLDQGLRGKILEVLATMSPCKWFAVDYVRIGYDKDVQQNNPVVILITVEEGQVSRTEGQKVVDALSKECRR